MDESNLPQLIVVPPLRICLVNMQYEYPWHFIPILQFVRQLKKYIDCFITLC